MCRKLIVSRTAHARGFDSIELLFLLRFPSSQSRGCVCMYVYWCRLQSRGLTYSACWAQNKLSPQIYEHKNKYETRYCQSLNKMTISSTLLHHVMTTSAISPRQSFGQSKGKQMVRNSPSILQLLCSVSART